MRLKFATGATAFARNPMALACSMALAVVSASARADQAADMQAKLDALQKQVAELQTQMNAMAAKAQQQQEQGQQPQAQTQAPAKEEKVAAPSGVRLKPGDALTFQLGDSSEVTLYGHVDVSADSQTTGLKNAAGATGHNGWVSDVSSNLSYFG